ncbi:MAG: ribonuclease J [Parcubacteria group bacterium CG11_big_fil_rev_8_21_14_0_20_39_14]|nr:MAG: ribonuclease J [Parcubacteria group bacterium CG11_big_fil_rev_8_21_14_0_20_39_14]PIS35109.1 MAG: ribonuclease J [Parcubacteria group bacterium CG08_land_8_20_14_0_20_38_56]
MAKSKKQRSFLRIIPLGGLGEVGKNMLLLEWVERFATSGKILIIDMGLQFPGEDTPGIDFIIPNIKYLERKEKNIVGVIFTHGHYDHIGAIPYLIEKLKYPKLFAAPLTAGIIAKRQEEFPHLKKLDIKKIEPGGRIKLGPFKIEFIKMTHNIPDTFGLFILTPIGNLFHTADFKFDLTPLYDAPSNINKLKEFGERKILMLFSDSTGAENPGHSISEKNIQENLEEIFKKAPGRIIAATFASLINRVQQIIYLSEKYGRKVAIDGYTMKTNIDISRALNYLKIAEKTLINPKNISSFADKKITVLCTGAQGEERAILMKIANKRHPYIKLKKDDSVIFSSSVIPGNERTVQILKDNLLRQGAKVFHYKMMDIHAGGHAQKEELKKMLEIMRPKFFMPVHGQYSMLASHSEIAGEYGLEEKNIALAENGDIIRINSKKLSIEKRVVPSNYVMVDGLGVGDVGEIVLRDRQAMAKDGMFVIIAVIDRQTGKVKGNPDIISRGFIYLRESKQLLSETRKKVIEIVEQTTSSNGTVNWIYIKDQIRNKIGEFLFQKTQRRPMVLPVVIKV